MSSLHIILVFSCFLAVSTFKTTVSTKAKFGLPNSFLNHDNSIINRRVQSSLFKNYNMPFFLRSSSKSIVNEPKKLPVLFRFLKNLWMLTIGNILRILLTPIISLVRKVFNINSDVDSNDAPAVTEKLKTVSINTDLKKEDDYNSRKEDAYRIKKEKDNFAAAKKLIEKQLKEREKSKKSTGGGSGSSKSSSTSSSSKNTFAASSSKIVLPPVMATPIVHVTNIAPEVTESALSEIKSEIITDSTIQTAPSIVTTMDTEDITTTTATISIEEIKHNVENAINTVESFISGISSTTEENDNNSNDKAIIVSSIPIRSESNESESIDEIANIMNMETESTIQVEVEVESSSEEISKVQDIVSKLFSDSLLLTPEQQQMQIQIQDIPTATSSIPQDTETILATFPETISPVVTKDGGEFGPYDMYAVAIPDFHVISSQIQNLFSNDVENEIKSTASTFTSWFEKRTKTVDNTEEDNLSLRLANIMDSLPSKNENTSE
eukprot:gene9928-20646_t